MKIKIKPNETIPNQTNSNQTKFYCLKKNLLVKIFGQKNHFWLRQKKFRKKIQVQKILLKKKFCSKKILAKEIWQKNLVEIDFFVQKRFDFDPNKSKAQKLFATKTV